MVGKRFEQVADAELDREKNHGSDDGEHFASDTFRRADPKDNHHRRDAGRDRHAVLVGTTRFDVDVGQHPAHTAQPACQQAGHRRKTARIPGQRAEYDSARGAEVRVLLVIGHWEWLVASGWWLESHGCILTVFGV